MENNIKRRIDFENRFLENGVSRFRDLFSWWKGRKLNKTTLLFILAVFTINLFIAFPLFGRDVSASFSSSAILILAGFLENEHVMSSNQFFSMLSIFSISFAPISYYLFVRKTAMRHELTAFVATLFFILPSPIGGNGPVLISAILNGDGAHAVAFSIIPLLILYLQAFIQSGFRAWGFIVILITALIAIISPFATFNLLIFFIVITISEGFFRDLRKKIFRLLFVISASFLLSFFWYYPNVITKIVVLSHVSYAISKLISFLPLLIPIIPILGLLLFLVFDRREKLKPIFLGLFLFLIYISFYLISGDLNIAGILTQERYLIELTFSASYLLALIIVVFIELAVRSYIPKIKNNIVLFVGTFVFSALVFALGIFAFGAVLKAQEQMQNQPILNSYKNGIGNIGRAFDFSDISVILASGISVLTFIFLLLHLWRSSSVVKAKEEVGVQEDASFQKPSQTWQKEE